LAQIYQALGVVSKGHLVETDRSGLVAAYVGQTALKVKEVVRQAIGGVLFIDEAYALAPRDQFGTDFGREVIDTLLKLMEDNRHDLIVIVAGYSDEMSRFLQANPGVQSRFNNYIDFEDYNPEQLLCIFKHFCKQADYKLGAAAAAKLMRIFMTKYERRDKTFGNARLARNFFEHTIRNQAARISSLPDINDTALATLEENDIPDN
jgi:stage V sporulation protein K